MSPSNPPGSFSSMPKGPFLESPHKTDILTGEPGASASHLSSPAGTVICCLPFAILFAVSICLISLSQVRVDRTWLDVIDRDTPARDFSGQPLTEHLHRALRGRVGDQPRHEDTFAHGRADHDDATARLHVLER